MCVCCLIMLCGCDNATGTFDAKNWKNCRLGVEIAYGSDYYLSKQDEISLFYRYDTMGEAVLALKCGYIDGIATERIYANEVVRMNDQLQSVDLGIPFDRIVACVTLGREELRDEINEYIAVFVSDGTRDDLLSRLECETFSPNYDIPEIADGEVIRVAIDSSEMNYPFVFYDFVSQSPQGFDIEFMKRFAWYAGYTIQWHDASWDDCLIRLRNGTVDVFACGYSGYYRQELGDGKICYFTDPYYDSALAIICLKEED